MQLFYQFHVKSKFIYVFIKSTATQSRVRAAKAFLILI